MTTWKRRESPTGELGLRFTRLTGSELGSRHRRFGAECRGSPHGVGGPLVLSSPSGAFRGLPGHPHRVTLRLIGQ